jgi:hypothetical protein
MNEVSQDNIGRPSIVRFETMSGVILHITPLNIATLRAINLKSDELFPYPDKKQYEVPLENAFVEGMVDSAENNPEYLKACEPVDQQRKEWTDKAVFHYAVRFQDYPTRESLINAFAPRLLELRKIALVQEDDYEAILHHLVLTGNTIIKGTTGALQALSSEYVDVIRIAIQTVALTPEEVTQGVRFFRANLRQDTLRKVVGQASSI